MLPDASQGRPGSLARNTTARRSGGARASGFAACALLALFGAPVVALQPPATCISRDAPDEVSLRVVDIPAVLNRLGLHEDLVMLRAEARVDAARLTPRPPTAGGCRYLLVTVATDGRDAPHALVSVRAMGGAGGLVEGFAASEEVTLAGGRSLQARRGDLERILAAVGRQVDLFAGAVRAARAADERDAPVPTLGLGDAVNARPPP